MKRLTKLIKETILNPIEDVIRPQAIRFYKETRPRDSNAYHYRYPSPASYPIDPHQLDRELDHRVPYKDSIYDIKNYQHSSAQEMPEDFFMTNGLTADIENQKKGKLKSRQGLFGDTIDSGRGCRSTSLSREFRKNSF